VWLGSGKNGIRCNALEVQITMEDIVVVFTNAG